MRITWTLLLSFCSLVAWSEDLRPRFEASTGLLWGQATELVLRDGTYNNPVSRLQWDIPPSVVVNLAASWPWTARTSTRIDIQTAFPIHTGSIVDEDWNTDTISGYLIYGKSTSTAILTSHWDGRLEETFQWADVRFLSGGRVLFNAWEGRDGSYDYSYDTHHDVGQLSGTGLTYRQIWILPYLGLEDTWTNPSSSMTVTLRGFPWAFCYDVDNHPLRDLKFVDTTQGGWYGQGSVELALPGPWTWGVRLSGEIAYGAAGDTTQNDSGTITTFTNSSGAWFYEASLLFFVRN